jgi:hypothetical protein
MKNGYFLLSRNIFESAIWRDDPHILKLFIYLIGKSRHSKVPKKYPRVLIKQGELVTSLSQISEDNEYIWNKGIRSWSRSKVSRMLETLEKQGYIKVMTDTYGTHISICNYKTYQNPKSYKSNSYETTLQQPCNNPATTLNINNNDNNDNNENNDKEYILRLFDRFWNMYDVKKAKDDCLDYWKGVKNLKNGKKMNMEMRLTIITSVPDYVSVTNKDGTFPSRKHPKTYLFNSSWLDEVTAKPSGNSNNDVVANNRKIINGRQ